MAIAVAKSLMRSVETEEPFCEVLVEEMRAMGEECPHPKGGYGIRFREWLDLVLEFDKLCRSREETFAREGKVKPIRLE